MDGVRHKRRQAYSILYLMQFVLAALATSLFANSNFLIFYKLPQFLNFQSEQVLRVFSEADLLFSCKLWNHVHQTKPTLKIEYAKWGAIIWLKWKCLFEKYGATETSLLGITVWIDVHHLYFTLDIKNKMYVNLSGGCMWLRRIETI